jgi:hypothetical protein
MTLIARRQETRIRRTLALAIVEGGLERYDAAVADLDEAEREHALREAGRRLRESAERLGQLNEVAEVLQQLDHAAAYRAVVLDVHNGDARGVRACVALLGQPGRLVAGLLPGVEPELLECGDEVEVVRSGQEHFAVSRRLGPHSRHGAVARVERVHSPSLLEVSHGPERLFLRSAAELERELDASSDDPSAVHGRLVSFDDQLGLAFAFFGTPERDDYVLRELPDVARDDLVLSPDVVHFIEDEIVLPQQEQSLASRFDVEASRFFIFEGPSGVGKTATARYLATRLGRPVYLISGAELADQWYGRTESKLRSRLLAAQNEPNGAVVVWDECESLLTERGRSQVGVEDRVVSLMLSFTDGFQRNGDVLMILTTNRASDIDHALRRHLRAVTVPFGRPDAPRVRQLFERYLRDVPCADADPVGLAREAALAVVAEQEPLAEAVLRDSSRVPISRGATISGALVRAACERARRRAFVRHARANGASANGGPGAEGILRDDLLVAIDEQFEAVVRTLTRENLSRVATLPDEVQSNLAAVERRSVSRQRLFVRDSIEG